VDRFQQRLCVETGTNLLESNYWYNNKSSSENVMIRSGGQGTNLLHYISADKSSLISVANQPEWAIFTDGGEAFLVTAKTAKPPNKLSDIILLQPTPLPPDMMTNMTLSTLAYTTEKIDPKSLKFKFTRLTTRTIPILHQRLFAGGIDNLLKIENQMLPELPFSRFYPAPGNEPPSWVIPPDNPNMDFNGAYGLYFWEIFFHAPFLIAARLHENQRFEEAKMWLQYVFNPTQQPSKGENPASPDRYWRFLPFRSMDRQTLRDILTDSGQIRRYNFDPFDPDVIASHRHVAYAKAIVLRYIDILLDWGDFLFAQDTSESINLATQLYVMAADLLGKRPESKGKMPAPQPKSFNEIKAEYAEKGIPQFLIELENTPDIFWNSGDVSYAHVPYNDIHAYFCVPENAEMMKYWDRVEDRLYKIRHCMNIDGVVRALALFEPPIDPRKLIRAAASGGLGMALSAQLAPSLPYYRFDYLLEKAKSLTNQLASLGAALLGALEKQDAEALNLLKIQQEKTILKLTTSIREQEVEDVKAMQRALEQSLNQAKYRQQFYDNLIKVGISEREQISMNAMIAALAFNVMGSVIKSAASIGYAVPQAGSPFAMTYGGQQIGNALNAASGVMEIGSAISAYMSQQALTMAGYDRRKEEWTLQEKLASYDIGQYTEQIAANRIRQRIAEQSLNIHRESIKQNEETEQFLRRKFTNRELYQWLSNRLSRIYFQTYSLAYEMALAAQKAFQYEYDTDQTYINFGYWEDRYKGLGAAEALSLALNQMEKAAVDNGRRPLEIEKTVSLLKLNPKALLDLKERGECMFEFGEKLFDYDFPGHYARKIKSVSVSIPAVIGPYQNINATLTQTGNYIVLKADDSGVNAVNFLLGGKNAKTPSPDALRMNWSVNRQVALTKGVNDNGLFELTAADHRYLPFEGTGAVSSWMLSMPKATNRFNFESITDVIVTIKYTAYDGGEEFRKKVASLEALKPFGGFGYLNFQQMFGEDWFRFMNDRSSGETQTLQFAVPNIAPPHVESARLTGFYVRLNAVKAAPGTYMSLQVTDSLSVDIRLNETNEFSYDFKADGKEPPALNKFAGQRRWIRFNLNETPSDLKDPNTNHLDPNVVGNIQIVVHYDGKINL
jgi:hypothetical protein